MAVAIWPPSASADRSRRADSVRTTQQSCHRAQTSMPASGLAPQLALLPSSTVPQNTCSTLAPAPRTTLLYPGNRSRDSPGYRHAQQSTANIQSAPPIANLRNSSVLTQAIVPTCSTPACRSAESSVLDRGCSPPIALACTVHYRTFSLVGPSWRRTRYLQPGRQLDIAS